ncbi:phosphate ABC transporter substrate-binding protein [Pseudanabaena sp. FACHB-1998]|uniref:phosphate ABC transporter substrate-binding protein n=1 Tax=Pseudanabaena sp. FACHB-1998 TaxID=2692858 RepID=UPI0016809412|nr:phosphate ABC transporter substrate-binding protein [Pseudanabaena sp. FACHB-1998]MBD2177943.1 phosphate ABC transporter substrate-binding protein [Pseudanabaena sp. FACHB-1998]
MSQGKETTVLVLSLLLTAGIAGGGYWFFSQQSKQAQIPSPNVSVSPSSPSPSSPSPSVSNNPNPAPPTGLNFDTSLPNPNVLEMDGSTTMVALVKELRNGYSQANPNIPTTFGVPDGKPSGSSQGLQNLINGTVAIAASSRPLKAAEAQSGVQLVPIAKDAIAVFVGINNPFKGNLTKDQVRDIYLGKITNWSQVGGSNQPIKVINRATTSGTREAFQDIVLLGQTFSPDNANYITWKQDETTAILRDLGDNGISYATVSQVEKQEIVRIVPIDGVNPMDVGLVKAGKYPLSRNLFLGAKKVTSPAVKQFIEFALSPQGQQIIQKLGFISIQ